ncbi:hypothetical protein Bbelb_094030 [Branchiostoma belcheri]|nr:hypothetical protein Bbelb_094030 [Branchiostoma belcheri]
MSMSKTELSQLLHQRRLIKRCVVLQKGRCVESLLVELTDSEPTIDGNPCAPYIRTGSSLWPSDEKGRRRPTQKDDLRLSPKGLGIRGQALPGQKRRSPPRVGRGFDQTPPWREVLFRKSVVMQRSRRGVTASDGCWAVTSRAPDMTSGDGMTKRERQHNKD